MNNERAILRLNEYNAGKYGKVSRDEPIEFEEQSRLNFVVWGDPQVSKKLPKRDSIFIKAIADIKENVKGKLDVLAVCGDISEWGSEVDYQFVGDLFDYTADKCNNFLLVPGNHDVRLRRYKKQVNKFMSAFAFGKDIPTDRYYFSRTIGGYRFIMLGTDKTTFEGSYLSQKQLSWLDNELKEATKDNLPVFVFNHQPLKHTNGLPKTWAGFGTWRGSVGNESDKLSAVLKKYPNVFYIVGHLHCCTSNYSVEFHDGLTTIAVQTIDAANHGDFSDDGQGMVVSVFDDRVVIRSRVFAKGKYVPDNIEGNIFTVMLK